MGQTIAIRDLNIGSKEWAMVFLTSMPGKKNTHTWFHGQQYNHVLIMLGDGWATRSPNESYSPQWTWTDEVFVDTWEGWWVQQTADG